MAGVQQARGYKKGEPRDALKQLNSGFPQQMVAATDSNYEQKLIDKLS